MCKRKYEVEIMVNAIKLSNEIGSTEAALSLGIPYYTITEWRKIYHHPTLYPRHAITRHFQGHSDPRITEAYTNASPDKIEMKAENDSVDVELKVEVKREIKGSYEMHNKNQRSYMPEFKEFAVALAKKIGDKEATEELGLRETAIPEWRSKLKIEDIRKGDRIKFLEKDNDELRRKASELKSENFQLRQYISNNYIASILQN